MPTFLAFYNDIAARLGGIAPCTRKQDLAQNTSPPRYLWIWKGAIVADGQAATFSANPRAIQVDWHQVEVHIWGKTEDDCDALRRALVHALRVTLVGRRYRVGPAEITDSENLTLGIKLVQQLEVLLDMPDTWDVAATPQANPGAVPSNTVIPATFPAVTITAVDDDPTGAVAGDGILQGGES